MHQQSFHLEQTIKTSVFSVQWVHGWKFTEVFAQNFWEFAGFNASKTTNQRYSNHVRMIVKSDEFNSCNDCQLLCNLSNHKLLLQRTTQMMRSIIVVNGSQTNNNKTLMKENWNQNYAKVVQSHISILMDL